MTSKSSANVVYTQGFATYRVSNNKVRSTTRGGFWAPTNELFHTLYTLFSGNANDVKVTVYYGQTGRRTYGAARSGSGGLRIGCNLFDAKNTKRLAKLVGFRPRWVKKYWPTAKAAAAGR